MVALIQRVSSARVEVDGEITGQIRAGMLILLGIHQNDEAEAVSWLVNKCAKLRIFRDDNGVMNRSILDENGEVLVVSQFTLYADTRKGNRPSYIASARPEVAEPLYELFITQMSKALGKPVKSGIFGAMMDVHLVNDGPVTLWIERQPSIEA